MATAILKSGENYQSLRVDGSGHVANIFCKVHSIAWVEAVNQYHVTLKIGESNYGFYWAENLENYTGLIVENDKVEVVKEPSLSEQREMGVI